MSFDEETTMPVNPFTDEHWIAELAAYNLRRARFHVEHVSIHWTYIYGRCDDYLNVNMRFQKEVKFPQLVINGKLWMSLTPMEIQSSALAIHRAKGHVLTGGLGLGYFALRAAAKPEVTMVTVFENEPLVVEWFLRMFKGRPELAKIKIIEGDMRETCKGFEADLMYADIYRSLLEDETFTDVKLFRKHNKIKRYMFWGYEKVVVGLLCNKMLKYGGLLLGNDLRSYLRYWQTTPWGDKESGTMAEYYRHRDGPPRDLLLGGRRVMTDFPM